MGEHIEVRNSVIKEIINRGDHGQDKVNGMEKPMNPNTLNHVKLKSRITKMVYNNGRTHHPRTRCKNTAVTLRQLI